MSGVSITRVDIDDAAGRLRELMGRATTGEEVELADGELRVKLVPVTMPPRRTLGQDEGQFEVPEDFDEPLPDDMLDAFGT